MNKFKQMQQTVILVLLFLFGLFRADAQEAITLAKALTIAETGSPDLQLSLLNLERFQQNLEAQRAAMKSRFSLDVAPVEYSNQSNLLRNGRLIPSYGNRVFQTFDLLNISCPSGVINFADAFK